MRGATTTKAAFLGNESFGDQYVTNLSEPGENMKLFSVGAPSGDVRPGVGPFGGTLAGGSLGLGGARFRFPPFFFSLRICSYHRLIRSETGIVIDGTRQIFRGTSAWENREAFDASWFFSRRYHTYHISILIDRSWPTFHTYFIHTFIHFRLLRFRWQFNGHNDVRLPKVRHSRWSSIKKVLFFEIS